MDSTLSSISEMQRANQLGSGLLGALESSKIGSSLLPSSIILPNERITQLAPNETPSIPVIYPSPKKQQNVVFRSIDIREEDDEYRSSTNLQTINVVNEVRSLQTLLIKCNEAAKFLGNDEIFKWTDKTVESLIKLSMLVPRDKSNFADLVDSIYFIFYEGAGGSGKLRFLAENGGPLEDAECGLIWHLKHLRNKWLRHDPDHGDEKDIKKSWDELGKSIQWFGIDYMPNDTEDYKYLHCNLLRESRLFLNRLLKNLTK